MLAVRPILRGPDLRAIEHLHAKARPTLMERAGAAAATLALQLLHTSTNPPLIVAGPGNNGGDALVVARILKEKGLNPVVIFAGLKEKLPADARAAHDAWLASGGRGPCPAAGSRLMGRDLVPAELVDGRGSPLDTSLLGRKAKIYWQFSRPVHRARP